MAKAGAKILSFLLQIPIYFYRWFISPILPPSCRHTPTCSQYALDAIKIHGPFRGLELATNRILRCRPGGTHGFDPVPLYIFRRYRFKNGIFARVHKCNRLKERD